MRVNNGNSKGGASKSSRTTTSSRSSRIEISGELFHSPQGDSSDEEDGAWVAPSEGVGVNDLRAGRSQTPGSTLSGATTRSRRTAAGSERSHATTASTSARRRVVVSRNETLRSAVSGEPHPYGLQPQRAVTTLRNAAAGASLSNVIDALESDSLGEGPSNPCQSPGGDTCTFNPREQGLRLLDQMNGLSGYQVQNSANVNHGQNNSDNRGVWLPYDIAMANNGGSLHLPLGERPPAFVIMDNPFSSDSEGEEPGNHPQTPATSILPSAWRAVKKVGSKICTTIYMFLMMVICFEKWCLFTGNKKNNEDEDGSAANQNRKNGHVRANSRRRTNQRRTRENQSQLDETRTSYFHRFISMFRSSRETVVTNRRQDAQTIQQQVPLPTASRLGSIVRSCRSFLYEGLVQFLIASVLALLVCLVIFVYAYLSLPRAGTGEPDVIPPLPRPITGEPEVTPPLAKAEDDRQCQKILLEINNKFATLVALNDHIVKVKIDSGEKQTQLENMKNELANLNSRFVQMETEQEKAESSGMETQTGLADLKTELKELTARLKQVEDEVKERMSITPEVDTSKVTEAILPYLKTQIESKVATSCESRNCPEQVQSVTNLLGLTVEEVELMIKRALAKYDADKTGLTDLALESAGGSILSTRCTKSSDTRNSVISYWGFPFWSPPNSPRVIIQPGVIPGECWAFEGSVGDIVIKLAVPALIDGFTLEHIPKNLSRYLNIDSAPKNFQVLGLQSEDDSVEIHDFGTFTYEDNDEPMQYFAVMNKSYRFYPIVELKILSNHGHMRHTCVYRFRVHGNIGYDRSHVEKKNVAK